MLGQFVGSDVHHEGGNNSQRRGHTVPRKNNFNKDIAEESNHCGEPFYSSGVTFTHR